MADSYATHCRFCDEPIVMVKDCGRWHPQGHDCRPEPEDGDELVVPCHTCGDPMTLVYVEDAGRWRAGHTHCHGCGVKVMWRDRVAFDVDGAVHGCRTNKGV